MNDAITAGDREMQLRGIIADLSLAAETDDAPLAAATIHDLVAWFETLGVFGRLNEAWRAVMQRNPRWIHEVSTVWLETDPTPPLSAEELALNAARAARILEGQSPHLVPVPDYSAPIPREPESLPSRGDNIVKLESLLDQTDSLTDVEYDHFVDRVEQLLKEFA
jgi:hypothetical protein